MENELLSLAKRLADYVRMTIEVGELEPDSPVGIAYRDFIEEWNMAHLPDKAAVCNFFGCDEPVCDTDKGLKRPGSLRFCQRHSDEINGYFREWNLEKIMNFWVRSHGGPERASRMM